MSQRLKAPDCPSRRPRFSTQYSCDDSQTLVLHNQVTHGYLCTHTLKISIIFNSIKSNPVNITGSIHSDEVERDEVHSAIKNHSVEREMFDISIVVMVS